MAAQRKLVQVVLCSLVALGVGTLHAAFFWAPGQGERFVFDVRYYDTSPESIGVFTMQLQAPIRVYTVPPAPPADFLMETMPYLGNNPVLDPSEDTLQPGTPYLFETDMAGFGCLRGKGIAAQKFLSRDSTGTAYNTDPQIIVPLDRRQFDVSLPGGAPYNFSYIPGEHMARLSMRNLLMDSITTPTVALHPRVLPQEEREKPCLLEVFDSEGELLASGLVRWFHFGSPTYSTASPMVVYFGVPDNPEDAEEVASNGRLFVWGEVPVEPVTIRRTIPGYIPVSVTVQPQNQLEVYQVIFPLVPDGSPDSGPFIGDLPANYNGDAHLLLGRLLDHCRNDPVGLTIDRNHDRLVDVADFIGLAESAD